MSDVPYDFDHITRRLREGATWTDLGEEYGRHRSNVQRWYEGVVDRMLPRTDGGMKILGIDIETAPNTVHVWGLYNQNVGESQIIQTGRVMCYAFRWFSDPDHPTTIVTEWTEGHEEMIRRAHRLLTEADAVVHYNGTRFDMPMLNREFIKYGLTPPATYADVDLIKVAKKEFKFASNRMDHLLRELGLDRKVRHQGHEMWVGCMDGDPEAREEMETYNLGDVDRMEALYERLLPWISAHPNHALYQATNAPTCTNCGGTDLQRRGYYRTKTQMYRRYQCQGCGRWLRERYNSTPEHKRHHTLSQAR